MELTKWVGLQYKLKQLEFLNVLFELLSISKAFWANATKGQVLGGA